MALRRKSALGDLSTRLDKARADLAGIEAALVTAARERAEAVGQLAEAGFDPVTLTERRAKLGAAEAALIGQREALLEAVGTLQKRCAALAVREAEGRVATLQEALVPFAEERDRIKARLVAIAAEEDELEEQIAEAVDAVRWAASAYDADAKAAADAARVQERERVWWFAREPKWSRDALLPKESPRVRRLVAEEIERLAATRASDKVRRQRESEESLAEVGLDVGERGPGEVEPSGRYVRVR